MITLYLDMDGVLADFNKEYSKLNPKLEDRKKFRWSDMEHKIFEKLDFMPDAQELLNHVSKLQTVKIEILTLMGNESQQANEAKIQKLRWLDAANIPYKANFVHSKEEKAKYADKRSILIDDSAGCIGPFIDAGGHGILHTNSSETIRILDATFRQIMILDHLNA